MPSGLRNLARWYIADIDGRYYSGHGEIIERGLDETQASLIGIAGMQPVEARKDLIKRGINNDIQSMYKYCDEGIDELLKAQAYYDMGGEYNDEYKQSTRAFTRAVAEYSKIIRERFGEEAANKWENKVFKRRFEKITDKNRNLPYNVLKYIEEMYKNDSVR